MIYPSFEEVLTFCFNKIKNKNHIHTKTFYNKLYSELVEKYNIQDITYVNLHDRYEHLIQKSEDFQKIDEIDKLAKSYKGNRSFYFDLLVFACNILKSSNLVVGGYNYVSGLQSYPLKKDFDGNITFEFIKNHQNYRFCLQTILVNIINQSRDCCLDKKITYSLDIAKNDIKFVIQSFNKKIYQGQDKFLTQFEQDLLDMFDIMFMIRWNYDELLNWSARIASLNQVIHNLQNQLNQKNEITAKLPKEQTLNGVEKAKFLKRIQELINVNRELKNQLQEIKQPDLFVDNIEQELLWQLQQMHPTAFEKFSLELIRHIAKVRGSEVEVIHNGQVGDGGIDGIIEKRHTFAGAKERLFVQCKRYSENNIGRPAIQQFVGAMFAEDINIGLFITTSSFSKQAIDFIKILKDKGKFIELFDGQAIVKFMIEHKIAITEKTMIQVDTNFFEKFS